LAGNPSFTVFKKMDKKIKMDKNGGDGRKSSKKLREKKK